jgi:hypothetical protein
MQIIQHTELTGSQATIDLTSIPNTFTDLYLVLSLRTTRASTESEAYLQVNSDTTSGRYQMRRLYSDGSSAYSQAITTGSDAFRIGFPAAANATSNTFSSFGIYIPNYAGSTAKSFSVDSVGENNATRALHEIAAGLYTETTAISSIQIKDLYANFVQYSSATLYGILKGSSGGVTVS